MKLQYNPGPDYASGYGRINVQDAVDMIRDDAACCNVIVESNITAEGEMNNYTIEVPAGTTELKVTIVWDDHLGNPAAAKALVNDLDLIAIGPITCHYPWVLNASDPSAPASWGTDDINNVEQIYVENPDAGTWIIRVNGTTIPEPIQNYSLVSSLPMREEDMTDVEWSIEKGLCWLHETQNPDGSWTGDYGANVGYTSIATLAFLNYGIDESDPTVSRAMDFILSNRHADGSIWNLASNYETSLAILPLVAADNTSYDADIIAARNFLVDIQNDEGEGLTNSDWTYGGWGYYDSSPDWSDLSNTQWSLMGLDAADLSKTDNTWNKAEMYVTRCQNLQVTNPAYDITNDGGFTYQPPSISCCWGWGGDPSQSYGAMTAAGVWSLRLTGVDKDDQRVQAGLDWLRDHYAPIDTVQNPGIGNTYLY